MATETVASDHSSTTDEQFEKKENQEAIGQKIVSLSKEDEDKHDKPEDAQVPATPSSKTEEEPKGDEQNGEPAAVQAEKSDDSPALEASAEDNNLEHDRVKDAKAPKAPLSKTEDAAKGDDKNAEPAAVVEKIDDSVSLEAVAENLKEEKELIPDSQTISVSEPAHDRVKTQQEGQQSTEPTVKETPQQIEEEYAEIEEEKQQKTAEIPESSSAEPIEKSINIAEINPLTESETEVVKETQTLETSSEKEEKQTKTDEIPESSSAEPNEKSINIAETNPLTESETEVVKETETLQTSSEKEEKQPKTDEIPESSSAEPIEKSINIAETNPLTESETEVVKETETSAEPIEKSINIAETNPLTESETEVVKETETLQTSSEKEEKQRKTDEIPESSSAEPIEKSINIAETNPLTESETEVVKETETLETSSEKIEKPEPAVTEVKEESEEPEKESQEKVQGDGQPNMVAIPEHSTETNDKVSDAIEEKTGEPELGAEVLKDTNNYEADPTETEKAEPAVTEVEKTPKELEKQSIERAEEEKSNTVTIPEPSADTSNAIEEKTREPELDAEVLNKANNYEAGHTETEKTEPVVAKVDENSSEPEKQSFEQVKEDQPNTIPELSADTTDAIEAKTREPGFDAEVLKDTNNYEAGPTETEKAEPAVTEVEETPKEREKQSIEQAEEEKSNTVAIPELSAETSDAIEVKTRETEFDAEVLKETNNYEAGPTETERTEPVAMVAKVDENASEPEKQSFKQEEDEQPKTIIPETAAESAEKPGDIAEVHPPKESDIVVVKESGNPESEAVPGKAEEKPELVSTEVEENPREQLVVAEEVGETGKDVEAKQELVVETPKNEETSDDTIKDPISLKEEKIDEEKETSITANNAQVSSNVVEYSPGVGEKVVEEDGKKESSFTNVIEGVSTEVVGVLKNPEQAETDFNEDREPSAPVSVEEKVAADDDKKEPEAPKVEEHMEATTEAEGVKVDCVNVDRPAVDNETKVGEIVTAVSEPVRETLASKLEEKEEKEQIEEPGKTEVQVSEPITKESDATKTTRDLPKETPAKPAHKQSNNIISKVKQSLVKAKKVITGKSPSSKNLSSDAKGDIKVK